jgi:hypothetical protein
VASVTKTFTLKGLQTLLRSTPAETTGHVIAKSSIVVVLRADSPGKAEQWFAESIFES